MRRSRFPFALLKGWPTALTTFSSKVAVGRWWFASPQLDTFRLIKVIIIRFTPSHPGVCVYVSCYLNEPSFLVERERRRNVFNRVTDGDNWMGRSRLMSHKLRHVTLEFSELGVHRSPYVAANGMNLSHP